MRKSLALAGVLLSCGGVGDPAVRDVTGNYDLAYDDQLRLQLNVGGAIREVTVNGYGNVADFGTVNGEPVTLDLTEFCARPEVLCPSERLWSKVAVDQPDRASGRAVQTLVVIDDRQRDLDAGVRASSVAGLIDLEQNDRFILGLGASGGASGNCAALAISLAGGRFSRRGERLETAMEPRTEKGERCSLDAGVEVDGGETDAGALLPDGGVDCAPVAVTKLVVPAGAPVEGIKDGKVFVGWAGGCAFGPALVGATLTLETGFTGTRTGDFDPPPYTPAEVVVPDGGFDAETSADAGP